MEEFLHVFLHALKDTAVLLPVLFIVYLLIELLEYKNAFKFENSKLLKVPQAQSPQAFQRFF